MNIIEITNKAGKAKLNDAIFKESTDKLLEEIGSVFGATAMAQGQDFGVLMNCAENAVDTMEIEIHSPGGSILDGYRIHHAIMDLRERGVHVTAIINTLAASMASVIAMAADTVKIVKGGRMMIHEASTATWGNAEDHARNAKLLDEMSAEIAGIYAARTGKPASEMRDRMKEETWMSAETAVSEGFADEVILNTPKRGTAKATLETIEKSLANQESRPTPVPMGFFTSKSELKQQVEALDKELEAANNEVEAISARLKAAEAELATARESLSANPSAEQIVNITKERDAALSELATAKAEASPEKIEAKAVALASAETPPPAIQKVIAARVTESIAAGGVPAPVGEAEQNITTAKTMTRDVFNALPHGKRNEFMRTGGKLS